MVMFKLLDLVAGEASFLQRYGVRIPAGLNGAAIQKVAQDEPALMRIYERLQRLPRPRTALFCSSDYAAIAHACGNGRTAHLSPPSDRVVKDKILGGWLGRAAGCILGKPLECGMALPDIKAALGSDFPIDDYLRYETAESILRPRKPNGHEEITRPCSREHIAYAMADDDLNYSVLNLLLLEQKGFCFSTQDVGAVWTAHLPPLWTYGAETRAFVNYLRGIASESGPEFLNPFRDEIGAQIRADMFGWVCPAHPRAAAELAFREASFSHVADGIYGAMFVAAMVATAFSARTVREIVEMGLAHVPKRSRVAELLQKTLEWHAQGLGWEDVYDRIKAATPQYHFGHTVNNAAYVANALLASDGDFHKGITIAVMQGHDTDCNGATVGSVLGVYQGAKRLPDKWIRPLHDCLRTPLSGYSQIAFSELAERTFRLASKRAVQCAVTPYIRRWRVSRRMPGAGKLERLEWQGRALALRPREFNQDFCDVRDLFAAKGDAVVWFLCELECREPMRLRGLLGYDGPIKVWVDDQLRFHDPDGKNPAVPNARNFPLALRAGRHRVAIALGSNGGLAEGLFLRFERCDLSKRRLMEGPAGWGLPTTERVSEVGIP